MKLKLTTESVGRLQPSTRRLYAYDPTLLGFGCVVHPGGGKVFFCQYRTDGGRRGAVRRVTLGKFGTLTVAEARASARHVLGTVAHGGDPAAARATRAAALTVAELGSAYLDDVGTRKKLRTSREYARLWMKHVIPLLGARRTTEVTPAHIAALHARLHATPYVANRVLSLCAAFFSYCERQGVRPQHSNPAREVAAYPEQARDRFLTPLEVQALGHALRRAETEGLRPAPSRGGMPRDRSRTQADAATSKSKSVGKAKVLNPVAISVIRFLLLSGWREQEALTLRWDAIDFERGIVTLADSKSGRSVRQLSAPALELLGGVSRIYASPFVFPGKAPTRPLRELNRVWYAVRHAAGLGDVRLHDLRHSFAAVAASGGGSLLMIGALLGHRNARTTARYAHLLDAPVRATADATGAQLSAWLGGEPHLIPHLESGAPVKGPVTAAESIRKVAT